MTKLILAFFLLISQVVIGARYNTHLNSILTIENNNVRLDSLKAFSDRMIILRDDIVIKSETELLKLAIELQEYDVFGKYSASLGTYYLSTVRPHKAKIVFKEALVFQHKIAEKWVALIRSKRASLYINENKPDSVIYDCKYAIRIFENYDMDVYKGDAHLFMGIAYDALDSTALSIEHYQYAQHIFEGFDDVEYVNYVKQNIAGLFLNLKFYDEALTVIQSMIGDKFTKYNINSYLLLNEVYFSTGDSIHYQNTLAHIDSVLENNVIEIEEQNLFRSRLYLYDHYLSKGDLDNAFRMIKQIQNQTSIINILANKLEVDKALCLYYFEKKDIDNMKIHFNNLKSGYKLEAGSEYQMMMNELEVKYNVLNKDFKTAYFLQEEILKVNNEVKANVNANKMAYLRTKFETEKKEKELEIANLEVENLSIKNEEKLYGLIAVIFLVILLSGVFALKSKNNKLIRSQIENDNLILQKEKEISMLKLQETKHELGLKEQELASHILSIVQKNELLDEMKKEIETNLSGVNRSQKLLEIISHNNIQEQDWDDFNMRFSRVHEAFFSKISIQFPQLSQSEKRLCALLKLNMNTKEIANVLHINARSVDQKKYRLKKKMNIDGQEDIYSVINKI